MYYLNDYDGNGLLGFSSQSLLSHIFAVIFIMQQILLSLLTFCRQNTFLIDSFFYYEKETYDTCNFLEAN